MEVLIAHLIFAGSTLLHSHGAIDMDTGAGTILIGVEVLVVVIVHSLF